MENYVYLKDISCKMFDFLCYQQGSAKEVKLKRFFFKVWEDGLSSGRRTTLISGSTAEGLSMNGSDIDLMFVYTELPIYNCKSEIDSKFGLITDTENAAPGFVLLKLPYGNIRYPLFQYTCSEYGLVLSSGEFKQMMLQIVENNRGTRQRFKIHGPCISSFDDLFDSAVCLKSETWPFVSIKWFHRPRYSQWPLLSDIEKISKEGLLYVPIGSKFGSKNENSLEWRISFSVPEKILVHSFNQAQLMCYTLLKIVLKEVINTNRHINNLFCSYFMKTVMFWLAEESDPSSWNPETLFTCFQSCLDRLIYWVRIGYCPNYFIPENNMFEGKIIGECQRKLLAFLAILRKEGVNLINRSATLSKFLSANNLRYNIDDSNAEVKAIYPLLKLFNQIFKLNHTNKCAMLQRLSGLFVNGGQLTKPLNLLWLVTYYFGMVETIPYEYRASNKILYRFYKFFSSYCLIEKKNIDVYGRALIATLLHRLKKFQKSLSLTNYALQECTADKYFVNSRASLNLGKDINRSNISVRHRQKLSCFYDYSALLSSCLFFKVNNQYCTSRTE